MDKDRIEKGIAAYHKERKIIARLIRRFGPLSEDTFDRLLRGRDLKKPKFRVAPINGDTFILGVGTNGFNMWAEWLELLQYMVMLGEVETTTKDGKIHYALVGNIQ